MKVKTITARRKEDFDEAINEFVKDKKVIDIKFSEWEGEDTEGYSALILYN